MTAAALRMAEELPAPNSALDVARLAGESSRLADRLARCDAALHLAVDSCEGAAVCAALAQREALLAELDDFIARLWAAPISGMERGWLAAAAEQALRRTKDAEPRIEAALAALHRESSRDLAVLSQRARLGAGYRRLSPSLRPALNVRG